MSIKKKFLLSSVLMLVIPLILIIIMSVLFLAKPLLNYSWMQHLPDDIGQFGDRAKFMTTALLWVALSIAIVVITGAVVTASLSRSIVRPMEDLRSAAQKIKDGNLDFEIIGSDVDEVQMLCRSFDEMRLRLKESVALKSMYEQERSQLMANIAHDLKTPLTSIKGYVEGIMDGVADTPEKMERYLSTILAKSQNMEEILENLSFYSKLDLGKVRYHFEHIEFYAFLRQIISVYRLDFQEAGMELHEQLADEALLIKADCENLRRVFSNIINNAIKYRNPDTDSYLSIITEKNERGVSVCFADNGIGISSKDIAKVFEGFYRSDPSRNSQIKGSGLGLAISKQIVEDHGGKIWLRSKEGAGTQVIVYLPIVQTEQKEGEK